MKANTIQQPNVLLIMVDQMLWNAAGALGGPALTPNFDRLARSGACFVNAYCPSPLCVPSRAAFMTGRLPRRLGVFDNGSELPASQPTVAHHLRRTGYLPILAGKMHFVGPDQLHGFAERLTGDISLSGLTLTPDWSRGAYPNEGSSVARLREPNVVDWTLQLAFDEEVESATLNRLRRLKLEEQRFFLVASFAHPHDPFRIPREYWDRYEDLPVPPPAAGPAAAPEGHHPYDRWIQIHHEADRVELGPETVTANRRAYFAMVSYIDDKLGRLLGELERLRLGDDTVVIFTSDHGEMLGEHGMWFKRTYFDPATKVPMVLSWPGRITPGVREEVVSLVDLSATLLELCGVADAGTWIEGMDGDSFLDLLGRGAGSGRVAGEAGAAASGGVAGQAGSAASGGVAGEAGSAASGGPATAPGPGGEWKDSAVSEYYAEGSLTPMLLIRKGRYKYVHVHDLEPRLFDVVADPHELHDLASDPAFDGVRAALAAELLADLDTEELKQRILTSQRERLAIVEAYPDRLAWAYRPTRDALELYRPARK